MNFTPPFAGGFLTEMFSVIGLPLMAVFYGMVRGGYALYHKLTGRGRPWNRRRTVLSLLVILWVICVAILVYAMMFVGALQELHSLPEVSHG